MILFTIYAFTPFIIIFIIWIKYRGSKYDTDKSLGLVCYKCGDSLYEHLFLVEKYGFALCKTCDRDRKLQELTKSTLRDRIKSFNDKIVRLTVENGTLFFKCATVIFIISIFIDILIFSLIGNVFITSTVLNIYWLIILKRQNITTFKKK